MAKESYLSKEFVSKMLNLYYRKEKMPNSKNYVILGIDLQNYFLRKGERAYLPDAERFKKILLDFYRFVEKHEVNIILTMHCHELDIMERWWHGAMPCNSESTEIVDEFRDYGISVKKRTYDAFYNTDLNEILKSLHVDTIVITGVMTHLCCETTARSAFVHGYNVMFPIDATLTQNSQLHEGSLRAIAHGFGPTPDLEEVRRWMLLLE